MSRWSVALLILTLCLMSPFLYGQGKISGQVYGEYFYNVARDTGLSTMSNVVSGGQRDFQAFQFRRVYFTYDHDIAEAFTARFRLEADQASYTTDGRIGVVVKDAFLRWKNIFSASDLFFGIQPTPAFEISESYWGFRSLEKTILDLRGIVSSRDFGLALRGSMGQEGGIGYWLMLANGTGNKPETDKYKRYYAHIHLKPARNMSITLYGDFTDRARAADPFSPVPATVSRGVLTSAVFVGYAKPDTFSVGVEGIMQRSAHDYINGSSLTRRNAWGLSLFAWYNFDPAFGIVGRFDLFDPNADGSAKGDSRTFLIGSLVYRPVKNINVMPNVVVETYETAAGGRSADASVTGRLTLSYAF